jgi:hypothetical protein
MFYHGPIASPSSLQSTKTTVSSRLAPSRPRPAVPDASLRPYRSCTPDARPTICCDFFQKTCCRYDSASFCAHAWISKLPKTTSFHDSYEQPSAPTEKGDISKAYKRGIGGALVPFSNGVQVYKFTLHSDFSAGRIN